MDGRSKEIRLKALWWSLLPKPDYIKIPLDTAYPRINEIPFSSETKRMTTLHQTLGELTAYAKGCARSDPTGCDWLMTANGVQTAG